MKKHKVLCVAGCLLLVLIVILQNWSEKDTVQTQILDFFDLTTQEVLYAAVHEEGGNEAHGELKIKVENGRQFGIQEELEKNMGEMFETEYALRMIRDRTMADQVTSEKLLHVYHHFLEGQRAKTVEVYAFLCEDRKGTVYIYLYY